MKTLAQLTPEERTAYFANVDRLRTEAYAKADRVCVTCDTPLDTQLPRVIKGVGEVCDACAVMSEAINKRKGSLRRAHNEWVGDNRIAARHIAGDRDDDSEGAFGHGYPDMSAPRRAPTPRHGEDIDTTSEAGRLPTTDQINEYTTRLLAAADVLRAGGWNGVLVAGSSTPFNIDPITAINNYMYIVVGRKSLPKLKN